jgi:DNA adenine methylase
VIGTLRRLRPPFKRHGGKYYLAPWIVPLMPYHRIYVEPFVGSGSVLLAKPPAGREVAGDLDEWLVGCWRVLQADPAGLLAVLADVEYTQEDFRLAVGTIEARAVEPDSPLGARAFLVRNRFSRGGLGKSFARSTRLRGGRNEQVNSWATIRAQLPAIAARVRGVEFRRQAAPGLVREFDGPDTLTYLDPPYLPDTRTVRQAYDHEMTRADHRDLLDLAIGCRGRVMISGYPDDLYDGLLAGWRCHRRGMPNHSGQGKSKGRRTECLWCNF